MRAQLVALALALPLIAVPSSDAADPPTTPNRRSAAPGDWTRGGAPLVIETSLAVSPVDPDVVFAALETGLARTTDGGLTWTHLGVDEGFGDSFALDTRVLIDPSNPQRIYSASYTNVRRSTDGGDHFTKVGLTGGLTSIVRGIALDPGAGPADTRVLATGYTQRVALSTDSGTTWTDKSGNVAAAGLGFSSASVLLHPTDPDVAFIASDSAILRTVNLTANPPTWTSIKAAPVAGGITDLVVAGGRLLASSQNGNVYRSADALNKATATPTWSASNIDLTGFATGLAPVGANGVLLASSEGVFKTVDITGTTPDWVELGGGLPGSYASDVATSSDGAVLYAAAGTSIYRSGNGGISWVARPGIVQGNASALASAGGRTYAATSGGLAVSDDGGSSWAIAPGSDGAAAQAVAVSSGRPSRVYAAFDDGLVRVSTDGGAGFAPPVPTAPGSAALRVDPADPDIVWSVGQFETVHRSDDAGATWTALTTGIPDGFLAGDIEIAPASGGNPSVVYLAGAESYVLASSTGGTSWTPLATGLPGGSNDVEDVAVDPTDPLHLLATVSLDNALYESVNGGASWTKTFGTDTDANPSALDLVQLDAVTFDTDGAILVASGWSIEESGRVYRSADGGQSFAPFGPPMDEVYNDATVLLADDQGVHVGTGQSGVVDLVRAADLAVSLAAPAKAVVGKSYAATVDVTSAGPDPATDVVVTVSRPAGTTIAGPGCTGAATLTCPVDVGDGSATLTLQVTAASTGAKGIGVAVDGAQVDTDPGDNASSGQTTVGKAASRLTIKAAPGRDASAPHTFTLSGTLTRPDGVAAACSGRAKIVVRAGRAPVVAGKQVKVARRQGACRWTTKVTFRRAPADRLVATVSHPGNSSLEPARPAKVTLRLT